MNLPAFSGHKKSINLLPKDSFETSGFGTVLAWALQFGKWSVIVTQLIVMGAFLWRFTLDRTVTNLRRQIEQEKAIIDSYSQVEANFKLAHMRLQFATPVLAAQDATHNHLAVLQAVTPEEIWYERLTFSPQAITVNAYSASLAGFSRLLTNLQRRPEFTSVSVGQIEDGGGADAQLRFDITLGISGDTQ